MDRSTRIFYIPILAYIIAFGYTFGTYYEGVTAQTKALTQLASVNGSYIDLIESDISQLREERALLASSEYALISLFIETHKDHRVPKSMVPQMVKAVIDAANVYSVPPAVILGVIDTESSFVPWAVSTADCIGLMQLNPDVWELNETEDYYDIKTNIMEGTRVLRYYVDRFGWDNGISSYNMGAGNTKRGIINIEYIQKVKAATAKFKKLSS